MDELRARLRGALAAYGAAITSIEDVADMGDAKPVQLSVQGPEVERLDDISEQVAEVLRAVPGVVDVDRSLDRDKPEVRVL